MGSCENRWEDGFFTASEIATSSREDEIGNLFTRKHSKSFFENYAIHDDLAQVEKLLKQSNKEPSKIQ
jgi:hypothetical protein